MLHSFNEMISMHEDSMIDATGLVVVGLAALHSCNADNRQTLKIIKVAHLLTFRMLGRVGSLVGNGQSRAPMRS